MLHFDLFPNLFPISHIFKKIIILFVKSISCFILITYVINFFKIQGAVIAAVSSPKWNSFYYDPIHDGNSEYGIEDEITAAGKSNNVSHLTLHYTYYDMWNNQYYWSQCQK